MGKKRETYRLMFTNDLNRLVTDLNLILARLEDRLDEMEATRGQYFTSQLWEKEEVK